MMATLELFKETREDIQITINSYLEDGELKLEGHDVGRMVKDAWGNGNSYEYFLTLSQEDTIKLFEKLGFSDKSDEEKLTALQKNFNWENDFTDFSKYCEDNKIKTSFSSWSGTDWD